MRTTLPTLALITLLPGLATLPRQARAQTYYYINSISVDPPAPTTSDPITITLHGDLSATSSFIIGVNHTVVSNTVYITVDAGTSGIGLPVLTPHDESFAIGTLPAGVYTINISGTAIWDMAPTPEHQFTVTGGPLTACDSLIIDDIQWAPFNDTTLVVHVHNYSTTLFAYPGFILYDSNGDTLAKEPVNFFGIGGESWHTLEIQDGATIPTGTFTGTVELWVWFGDTLACTWPFTGDLCPPDPCNTLLPFMVNTGGAIVTANISWTIIDSTGAQVGLGTFDLDALNQQDYDTLCLPIGAYTLIVNHPTPVGGQLQISAQAGDNYWATLPGVTFTQDGLADLFPFDFYPGCFDSANGLEPLPKENGIQVMLAGDQVRVIIARDGRVLGDVFLLDLHGRILARQRMPGMQGMLDLAFLADGAYVLWLRDRAWAHRVVKF